MKYKILQGDCLEKLDELEENSIDCIVTDPPYELNFMGKGWDNAGVSFQKETWEKCLRVLKPGGYLLAFGGTRTYHRIACAIEDAGFEIRDCIMWLYGSGFPKSMDIEKAINKRDGVEFKSKPAKGVGFMNANDDGWHNTLNQLEQIGESSDRAKNWKGWGSALKPSFEPIIVARKPLKGSLIDNVLQYGVGGINIDECRVGNEKVSVHNAPKGIFANGERNRGSDTTTYREHEGRFPANTILTYDEIDFDEVCGGFPQSGSGKGGKPYSYEGKEYNNKETSMFNGDKPKSPSNYNDNGSASRYFYCAKASKKDRDEGLEDMPEKKIYGDDMNWGYGNTNGDNFGDRIANVKRRNTHPTVKPTSLMQYLIRLVAPKGATILDPFMGSGSTGKAVAYENKERDMNYSFIGIEQDPEYCKIAKARIDYACEGND